MIIDYAHSPAALTLQPILSRFRWRCVVALNAEDDESRLSLTPEEFEASLHQLAVITSSIRASFGVRLDIGGEKLFVVDDLGRRVDGWRVFAAIALMTLEQNPGGMIAAPTTAPNVIEWVCQQHGARLVRTKVEPQAVMAAATQSGCVLAGDGDGGLVFPCSTPEWTACSRSPNSTSCCRYGALDSRRCSIRCRRTILSGPPCLAPGRPRAR